MNIFASFQHTLSAKLFEKLSSITHSWIEVLGDNLVGIYLHGSLAHGGYNGKVSDVDLLVVVRDFLKIDEKQAMIRAILDHASTRDEVRLEMSVVLRESISFDGVEVPFELHYSPDWFDAYRGGTASYDSDVDPDLPVHFYQVKHRGTTLFGGEKERVFESFDERFVGESIQWDVGGNIQNILDKTPDGECRVPRYAVLNLVRAYMFFVHEVNISKAEVPQYLERFPEEYRTIILAAVKEYTGESEQEFVSGTLLMDFARFIQKSIPLEVKNQ
jgi:predicted nucleotidyltransferase